MKNPYENIINLANHRSSKHPHMSKHDRGAQFSPFMALTGYESAIVEVGRLTEERVELDEYIKEDLNKRLQNIKDNIDERPVVTIVYFKEDKKKPGGKYIRASGFIKKIYDFEGLIAMEDDTKILINDIIEIIFSKE